MGKENRQFIVVVAIILAAVVLLDVGNSRLSGRLIDLGNVNADEDSNVNAQLATTGPEKEDLSPSSEPASLRTGGQVGIQSISPLQPMPEKRTCTIIDHTKHVQTKFPNDLIYTIRPLEDKQMQYFIINLQDAVTGKRRWVIYDVQDNSFSADDKTYSHNLMNDGWFGGEMGVTQSGNEKIFWIYYDKTLMVDGVASCTLPQCTDAKVEFTVSNGMNIERLSPSLLNNRIAMILSDQVFNIETLYSCSLNYNDNDACNKPETQYKKYATNIAGISEIRDGGIVYVENSKGYVFSSNVGALEKIVQLPTGTNIFLIKRLGPGQPYILFTTQSINQQNLNITELFIFDLVTGIISPSIENFPNDVHQVHFIGLLKGKIYTIYEMKDSQQRYFKKEIGLKENEIFIGDGSWIIDFKQFQNGKVMARKMKNEIISFDCTP